MRKVIFLSAFIWVSYVAPSVAREVIWRCGQIFTDAPEEVSWVKKCHVLANGRLPAVSDPRVHGNAQRERDVKARAILEAELRQAEQQLALLLRSSAKKATTQQGNKQAEIMRIRGDIAGLQREIERLR